MSQTKSTPNDTTERVKDLNEQVLDLGRKAGVSFVDAYESTLTTLADYQDKVAQTSQVEWVTSIGQAQANFTRDVAKVYASTARELLVK